MPNEDPPPLDAKPRIVDDFLLIEPSGRRHKFRRLSRVEKIKKFATVAILMIISGAFWILIGASMWRSIAPYFD